VKAETRVASFYAKEESAASFYADQPIRYLFILLQIKMPSARTENSLSLSLSLSLSMFLVFLLFSGIISRVSRNRRARECQALAGDVPANPSCTSVHGRSIEDGRKGVNGWQGECRGENRVKAPGLECRSGL